MDTIGVIGAIFCVLASGLYVAIARRERAKLIDAIVEMNREALLVYHCNRPDRCSKCWGNAKAIHDIAINICEPRGLLNRLS